MTPLQFESAYAMLWDELEQALDALEDPKGRPAKKQTGQDRAPWRKLRAGGPDGARLTALYRRACEHLALAQARAYPVHLTQRLEQLTQRGHRAIYRRHDYGIERLKQLVLIDIPQSVRAHRWYLLAAALLFVLPTLLVGWAAYHDPTFVLHVVDANQVEHFDSMYGDGKGPMGRERSADTDWKMFGYYIMHNIGIGFQCFAGGVFAGVGSVFYLVFNGVLGGAIGGYLTSRGYGENFYSFIVTHSAFELTAIVLSGAAGLRIGHAVVAPGRRTRIEALKHASTDAIVVIYGVIGMLLIAAFIEAFWSSARWVSPYVKYGVGAACWALVATYLGWQGRPAAPLADKNQGPS